MKLSDFDYSLPQELIAQTPLKERTDSRLMVLNKKDHSVTDGFFKNFVDYLDSGDLIVFNNSRVLPARLFAEVENYIKKVEVFLLEEVQKGKKGVLWKCLGKPGKKLTEGIKISINENFKGEVVQVNADGSRLIKFNQADIYPFLEENGEMPLPPYIKEKLSEKERYQTVYSKKLGSVAAPTAGLHFTDEYLEILNKKGIKTGFVTLNVGLGTFLPVKTENVKEHKMHREKYEITEELVEQVNEAKKNGKRVIAVGTTSMRVLESSLDANGNLIPQSSDTDIFIYPPYDFKIVDALLTNFHLPKSTLLMLVSALAGKEFVFEAYRQAVDLKYRFFSFGDAMLII